MRYLRLEIWLVKLKVSRKQEDVDAYFNTYQERNGGNRNRRATHLFLDFGSQVLSYLLEWASVNFGDFFGMLFNRSCDP
jgi:hypothetical protein